MSHLLFIDKPSSGEEIEILPLSRMNSRSNGRENSAIDEYVAYLKYATPLTYSNTFIERLLFVNYCEKKF